MDLGFKNLRMLIGYLSYLIKPGIYQSVLCSRRFISYCVYANYSMTN